MAVVEVYNGYSRDKLLIHLIKYLFFISEHIKVQVEAVHCPGKDNIHADALSRNDVNRFFQASPGTDLKVADIPLPLLAQAARLDVARPDCSQPLSGRLSPVHTKNLHSRKEKIHRILWQICSSTTTNDRKATILVCGTPTYERKI